MDNPAIDKSKFETRVTATASGGKFCDGWILAVIGIVLPLTSTGLGLTPAVEGVVGASSLIGLFIGGLAFGWITDKIGRRKMFTVTLLIFLICSILQLFVEGAGLLIALRMIMGMAIGADYAIGGAMIAEFTTLKHRGPRLAGMLVWFYAGFSFAAVASIITVNISDSPDIWRWVLASSAVPALIMLIARIGMPESPHWLANQGRTEEATRIAEKYLDESTQAEVFEEREEQASFSTLFSAQYRRRTALTSIFWACQVAPFFAIYVFLPRLLESANITVGAAWSEVILNVFLLVGSVVGALIVNKVGRRKLLIYPFVGMGTPLLILGIWPSAPFWILIFCMLVFAFSHAAGSVLQMLYPSEIFPTEIRATAVGFSASMSRVGAAISTFLMPIGLAAWGIGPVMLIGAGICAIGLIVSVMWAPETSGLKLSETSSIPVVKDKSLAEKS